MRALKKIAPDKTDGVMTGIHHDGFSARVRSVLEGQSARSFAQKAGIKSSTLQSILRGARPTVDNLVAIASASGVSIDWLATGGAPPPKLSAQDAPDGAAHPDVFWIPRYDTQLATGDGAFADRAVRTDTIALTAKVLGQGLEGLDLGNCLFFTVEGDSMAATLNDGDVALIHRETHWRDGLWAFSDGALCRLRRLQFSAEGVRVINDNREAYPPEFIPAHQWSLSHELVGRVRWAAPL